MSTVLIIEDEEFYRNFLQKIVSSRYSCDAASSGDQARELLRTGGYEVVLYDLRLPGCSGKELVQFVKREIDPDIINIVITGYERDWSPVDATEENVFFYLKKGHFHPDDLLKIIDSALQTRQAKLREKEYVGRLITSEKIAQAGKLATGIAHEINNPLQSLVLILERFREKIEAMENPGELARDLELLEMGVERIGSVVKQLLELYRIDRSQTQVDRLDSIIEKVVGFLRPIGREQNTAIEYRSSPGNRPVCVAENQFFYVLVNICLTLLDYRHREIKITPRVKADTVIIRVESARKDPSEAPGASMPGASVPGASMPEASSPGKADRRANGARNPAEAFGIDISKGILRWFNGSVRMAQRESGEVITITLPLVPEPSFSSAT